MFKNQFLVKLGYTNCEFINLFKNCNRIFNKLANQSNKLVENNHV